MKKFADDDGSAAVTFLIIAFVIFVVIVLCNTPGLPLPHLLVPP